MVQRLWFHFSTYADTTKLQILLVVFWFRLITISFFWILHFALINFGMKNCEISALTVNQKHTLSCVTPCAFTYDQAGHRFVWAFLAWQGCTITLKVCTPNDPVCKNHMFVNHREKKFLQCATFAIKTDWTILEWKIVVLCFILFFLF